MQAIQQIDSQAWRTSQGAPFQFARWVAAMATVLIDWAQFGPPQNAVAYLPVLTSVALLLLPDAKSIGVGSLKFERLTSEVGRQKHAVDRPCEDVSFINNSLIAGSQVSITLGAGRVDAAVVTAASRDEAIPGERSDLIAPHLTVEDVRPEHELQRVGARGYTLYGCWRRMSAGYGWCSSRPSRPLCQLIRRYRRSEAILAQALAV